MKRPLIPLLILPLLAPLAGAQERTTGFLPPTAEQQAWMDENMVKVTNVLPNRLALQRVAAERQKSQKLSSTAKPVAPAEDGAEIVGFKGAAPAKAAKPSNLTASLMAYPRAVDNSAESWFPPIGSQGGLGSCAVFSSAYYTMTSQVARTRGWNVKSGNNPAQLFSPRFVYNMINGGGNNGTHYSTAYEYMIALGSATYADFPYNGVDCTSWPTDAAVWRQALNYRMSQSGFITGIENETGLAKAKQMLADGYIFNFSAAVGAYNYTNLSNDPATTADDGFFAAGVPFSRRDVVSYCKAGVVDHAMTIVGYNDDLWCDINGNGSVDSGEKGALRLANSWGTGYRDGGFTWVSYDSLKKVSAVAGGYSGPRQDAVADGQLWWMSARQSYTPSMVAEITVTHGKRNQMILDVGRGPSSSATPAKMGRLSGLANKGGSWSFNGTTTPVAATFVLDCTDLMASGTGNRWFASLSDNTAGDPGAFTSVRFVNGNGAVTVAGSTTPGGGLPKSVDNTIVHAYADDVDQAVIPVIPVTPVTPVGPDGYIWCVGEGGSFTLPGECNVAYGANGKFTYSLNRSGTVSFSNGNFVDPIQGVYKSGFYKPLSSKIGPAGFTWCSGEFSGFTLPGLSDVAFGSNGKFTYLTNRTGAISFNASTFGTDPNPNVLKSGFYRLVSSIVPPAGYTWCAGEGGSFTLPGASDVAYGANGMFNFVQNRTGVVTFNPSAFGGDPNNGILKSGFYKLLTPSNTPVGPAGYTWCSAEFGTFTLPGVCDLAYGANGAFVYKTGRSGTVTFNTGYFGFDPIHGVTKSGFYKRTLTSGVLLADAKNLANSNSAASSKVNGVESAIKSGLTKAGGSVGTCNGKVITFKKRPTASGTGNLTYQIEVSSDLGKKDPWTKVDSTQTDSEITAKLPKTRRQVFARLCVKIKP
jgi:Papain family cysteine protease